MASSNKCVVTLSDLCCAPTPVKKVMLQTPGCGLCTLLMADGQWDVRGWATVDDAREYIHDAGKMGFKTMIMYYRTVQHLAKKN